MSYREKKQVLEGAPDVNIRYVRGRFQVSVQYWRTLRSGNDEDTMLVFRDVDPDDLRCLARSLHDALGAWGDDWNDLKDALKGEDT